MIERNITARLLAALADTPVVFLAGARQSGKSTLARALAAGPHPARYLTFDDTGVMAAAHRDPAGFIAGLEGDVVLDEMQRVPELSLALKAEVDRVRRPGRFLLTGSANVVLLPAVAQALAGRIEVCTLWPFSIGETGGVRDGFIDATFAHSLPPASHGAVSHADIAQRVVRGGFPEVQERRSPARRAAWFSSYLSTIMQRDVRDLSVIEGLAQLPHLLALIAARNGALLNFADLSRSAAVAQTTLKRYLALLEALFLVHRVPAWSANLTTRLVKAPKLYVSDSGVAAHLVGASELRLAADPSLLGSFLEGLVVAELVKQATWNETSVRLFHFRTHAGREVDLVLEDPRGRLVAIEVKAAATLGAGDAAGIEAFAGLVGPRFHRGIVLYTGREVIPFAANIHALPLTALWQGALLRPAG
jgi:hypothetical protein